MRQFTDEWIVPALGSLVADSTVAELRRQTDEPNPSLWLAVLDRRLAPEPAILQAVATRFRMPIADLAGIDQRVIHEVPEQLARRFHVVPLKVTDSYLEVATANPFDMDAEKMLAFATGREVRLALCSPNRIREKLDEVYRPDDLVEKLLGGIAEEAEVTQLRDDPVDDLAVSAAEAAARPIIKLVDTLLADGITSRASDIHVEPSEGGVVVRYRIDGVLRQVMKIPRSAGVPLISRIKIMSGMDIADRLRPQDGRCRVAVNGNPVDLRVSTLPASLGEKVVIRILNTRATLLSLDALGFEAEERAMVKALLDNKEGILLVTGPTGSGKTTTLYAALQKINNIEDKIITVEDPVEYQLGGIKQIHVNPKIGLTFGNGLRAILRHDPDIIMIGEIRDLETAEIAVQSALTGHLVFSTLHTNDAPTAITRLVDMGLEPFLVASTVEGLMAQRLVRRVCKHCKFESARKDSEFAEGVFPPDIKSFWRGKGCEECRGTGYKGRQGVFELLVVDDALREMILKREGANRLKKYAMEHGMRTLRDDGWDRVRLGVTTPEEVIRITKVDKY